MQIMRFSVGDYFFCFRFLIFHDHSGILLAVYDGHEGREAVDYAREKLHEHVRGLFSYRFDLMLESQFF